jgi:hypothetical protein
MFKISDNSSFDFIELTSSMLEYNGKLKLEKYPIFDPTIEFTRELKQQILEMTYEKKMETFFHTPTFQRKIVNAIDLHQDLDSHKIDAINKENKNGDDDKTAEIIKKEREVMDTSFEFIIQCIFCTGLPLSNYYKTMEFYDIDTTKKKEIARKTPSLYDYITPTQQKRCFSYLKLNGKKYTVTGLTWINDVLNHPTYMDIISKYKKYEYERKKIDPSKNAAELNMKLNCLILDIHDLDVYKISEIKSQPKDSTKEKELIAMRNKIRSLFETIRNARDIGLFDTGVNDLDGDVGKFIKGYRKIQAEYAKEKDDNKKSHRIRELVLIYNAIINKGNNHKKLRDILNEFNTNAIVQKFKIDIKSIFSDYTDDEFQYIIRGQSYYSSFIKYFRTLKGLFLKGNMYEIVLNDLTYQDRNPAEIKQMDALIEKEVKNYYDYRQAFKKIEENRVISNIHWKKEADIINGEAGVIEDNDVVNPETKPETLFEIIMKCNKNNNTCQLNKYPKAVKYLDIGLEQINKNDKTKFTYEAYINLEVVEGVYNDDNYKKLLCPYISNVLGDAYDEMVKKEGKNNVMRNRVFVQNQNVDSKPSDKNKTTRPQSKPQKKKGGTKVRTKKKKSRFY